MNVELLVYALLEIVVVLCFLLFWRLTRDSNLALSEAIRRANELLRSVLNSEQYDQLTRKGYLDIKSPRDPGCMYRVPRRQGAGEGDRAGESQGEPVPATAEGGTR